MWDEHWQSLTTETAHAAHLSDSIKYEYLRAILPRSPSPMVLDVGCGSATLSMWLARDGFRVTCLDTSPAAVRLARQRVAPLGQATFLLADGQRLPFLDQSFDLVLSTGLIEHFRDPEILIREMVRVLRPGGVFYSDVVPAGPSLYRLFNFWRELHVGHDSVFEGHFSRKDVRTWLIASGLEGVSVRRVGVLPPAGLINRVAILRKLAYWMTGVWTQLDRSVLAAWLGYYLFAYGRKPSQKNHAPFASD